jgi:CO dehydrogenase maturation factor
MKIIISGKGGSGKSTITALLAKDLMTSGFRILVVDADESNFGLSALLGMNDPTELMELLGGKKVLGEKMRKSFAEGDKEPMKKETIFDQSWSIDEIPGDCVSQKDGLSLLEIGKVKHFGEGCACPMGGLSREFLDRLKLESMDIAIIDTEAGVEHLGRGVEKGVDLILVVLDPSFESLRLANKISTMANEASKPVYFILNKVEDGVKEAMLEKLDRSRVIGVVPRDRTVERKGLTGEPLESAVAGLSEISGFVMDRMARGSK